MNVKDIQEIFEARGVRKAPPDHPIYSGSPTIRFINRPRATTPAKVIDAEQLNDEHKMIRRKSSITRFWDYEH